MNKYEKHHNVTHDGVTLVDITVIRPEISAANPKSDAVIDRFYDKIQRRFLAFCEDEVAKTVQLERNSRLLKGLTLTPARASLQFHIERCDNRIVSVRITETLSLVCKKMIHTEFFDIRSAETGYPLELRELSENYHTLKKSINKSLRKQAALRTRIVPDCPPNLLRLVRNSGMKRNFLITNSDILFKIHDLPSHFGEFALPLSITDICKGSSVIS